jgi:pimeloyl-ACP methyl ester carboxylesterase
MLSLTFLTGAALGLKFLGNNLLFPRSRFKWSKNYPIEYTTGGVSYIYDRPEMETVVIFSHGNGGNILDRDYLRNLSIFQDFGIIMYDYYGYGCSEEVPTLLMNKEALTKSLEEIYNLVSNKNVILIGESLGSYPTCWLASRVPIEKIILFVPFDTIASVNPIAPYILGPYNNLEFCRQIKIPCLIISAEYDRVMPAYCGENLKKAFGTNGKLVQVQTNHSNYLTERTINITQKFLLNDEHEVNSI